MTELTIHTNSFKATDNGLQIVGEPTEDEWLAYGDLIREVAGAIQWVRGDWIVYGFDAYQRNKWEDIQEKFPDKGLSALQNEEWVARSVKSSTRVELSWTHHRIIADLPEEDQEYWLREALDNEWSTRILTTKIAESSHITLLYGDMLEILPTLGKFELIVTDPPYGVTDYEWDVLHTREWLEVIKPQLAEEYNLFWFCSPKYSADIELLFRELELPIQSRIIWHRRNMARGSHAKNRFVDTWEMIFHAGTRELNFPEDWSADWFDVQTFAVPQTNFKDGKIHPTQKPEGLIARLVEFGSYEGDKIIDPFAGSGTVGLVCPNDRECTLIEIEEGYVGITEARLGIKRQKRES